MKRWSDDWQAGSLPGAGETCPGRSYRVGERMLLLLPGFDKISEKLEKEIDAHLSLLFELNFTGVTSFL